MEIGIKLKELRLKNQLTQEELADRSELTKGYISQLENDLTSPSIATLKDILQALGSSLSAFFSEDEEEPLVFTKEDYFLKEGENYLVEFGSEDTKTRAGVKYKIQLPASKNKDNCLEAYAGKEVIMGIRPENVHNEEDLIEIHKDGIVEADVEVTELMGAETYLYMNCEGQSINARVSPTNTARPGDKIKIAFETAKIHLFDKETELTICN